MAKATFPVLRRQRAQQAHPAIMQRIEQAQRHFDWCRLRVAQLSPKLLLVRLDGGFGLRERKLEPDVGVHVAVGHMMRNLSHSPSPRAVRCVELRRREPRNGSTEISWHARDVID